MGRLTDFAVEIANEINRSGILPAGSKAEFCALLARNVEDVKGLDVRVCPHGESKKLVARRIMGVELTVDVVVQFKLRTEKNERVVAEYGEIADALSYFFDERDVGGYRWLNTEYAPYSGELLEQYRVFASVVSVKYYGQYRVKN